jgi:ssDNA thymidine ADP-ribosyltransferase, DarT
MGIQGFVAQRRIKYLFHFTRLENLDSILTRGLLTPSGCSIDKIACISTDHHRFDQEDAICASIEFPNYKMFYRSRCALIGSTWAVLGINPKVLWEKNCAFCKENAASTAVTCLPLISRQGEAAFRSLFDDFEGKPRASLNIPDSYPTNPQAEVLILEAVEPRYIVGAAFNAPGLKAKYAENYDGKFEFIDGTRYFSPRCDYAHWR